MRVTWHAVPGKGERATSVPEGRLMSPLVPKIFCIEVYAMRFEKRQILLLKSPSAMVFKLVLDVMNRLWHLRNAHAKGAVALLPTKGSQFSEGLVDPG